MLEPGARIGDWVVEGPLGEGGMGAVYRAHNALVPRILAALKVLKPHALEDARERFFREVIAVDELRHPHIVRVKGFGEDAERKLLWMAMELVEGHDIGALMASGPTPPNRVESLIVPLLDALAHAHAVGIHHRDIKPSNILVAADGRAKLLDFGIATQEGLTRLTRTGMVVGTPAYMPPEIFGDEAVSPAAADIYAMGQVAFELLTGAPAYPEDTTLSEGQRMARMMSAKMRAEPLDPGVACSDALRRAIRRATDPDPATRFSTAQAFADAVKEGGGGDAAASSPETRWVASTPVAEPVPAASTWESQAPTPPPRQPSTERGPAEPPAPRRGWLWLGLGVVASLVATAGVVLCVGGGAAGAVFGGVFEDPFAPAPTFSFQSSGVQLPVVTGATQVPLRAFLVMDAASGTPADEDTLRACADGEDVVDELPLVPAVVQASAGGDLLVGGVIVGKLDADGHLPAADLEGRLHAAMFDRLYGMVEESKGIAELGCSPWLHPEGQGDFPGRVLLVLDARLPYSTVLSLVHTAGQAEFSEMAFVVSDPEARLDAGFAVSPSSDAPAMSAGMPAVHIDRDGYRVGAPEVPVSHRIQLLCDHEVCPSVADWPVTELSENLSALRSVRDAASVAILSPAPDASLALVAHTMARTRRAPTGEPLFPDAVLAGGGGGAGGSSAGVFAMPPAVAETPFDWGAESRVTVLPVALPSVGASPPRAAPAFSAKVAELSGAGPLPGADGSSGVKLGGLEGMRGGGSSGFGSAVDPGLIGKIGGLAGPEGSSTGTAGLGTRGSGATSGAPKIMGALDRSLIDAVIKRHMNQIRYCYQRELTKEPSLGGKMTVKFVIAKDGSVSAANTESSTMGNSSVESCIVGRFRRMRFPEPKGGGIVVVVYPFEFSAG